MVPWSRSTQPLVLGPAATDEPEFGAEALDGVAEELVAKLTAIVRIPTEVGHPFRLKWATRSEACGPPIPTKWATCSDDVDLSFRQKWATPRRMSEGDAG